MNSIKQNVIIEYKGPFGIDILASMGTFIRQMFVDYPETCNRLYKLFFELTQNVAKYSAETRPFNQHRYSGVGSFRITEMGDRIVLKTSNLIKNSDGPVLSKYCSEINNLNKEELRQYKSDKRKLQPTSTDTGAHIGIIQIGILTSNQLEVKVHEIDDDFSLFTISATIQKNN